jgi:hypothetical protein
MGRPERRAWAIACSRRDLLGSTDDLLCMSSGEKDHPTPIGEDQVAGSYSYVADRHWLIPGRLNHPSPGRERHRSPSIHWQTQLTALVNVPTGSIDDHPFNAAQHRSE